MSEPCDIAVVGAGPAGAVTALLLARAGRRVTLYEKEVFPRRKVCGCCVNGHALSALAAAKLGDLPASLGAVPLTHTRLAANGRTAEVKLPAGFALGRDTMDAELVRRAQREGVKVHTGFKVKLGELRPEGWELDAGGKLARAKVVIDAAGLNGRLTGTHTEVSATSRIGAGALIDAPPDYPAGIIHMAAGGGGYVGLVRVESGLLDVAAAVDAQFVKKSGGLGRAAGRVVQASGLPPLPGLSEADWKGTPPLTRTPQTVAGPRWFAVGDSTGYVEPFTGEGMAWALAAAVSVVPIADAAVDGWHQRHADEWARVHRRVVARRQGVCRWAARVLRNGALCSLTVRVLSVLPVLAVPVVRSLNRPLYRDS